MTMFLVGTVVKRHFFVYFPPLCFSRLCTFACVATHTETHRLTSESTTNLICARGVLASDFTFLPTLGNHPRQHGQLEKEEQSG